MHTVIQTEGIYRGDHQDYREGGETHENSKTFRLVKEKIFTAELASWRVNSHRRARLQL